MAILFAGGALVAGILGQYLIFDQRLREIIPTIEIQRTLSRNPVRRGAMLQVTGRLTIRNSAGMHVQITDLPPRHAILVDGTTTVTAMPAPSVQAHRFSYRIIPVIHGTLHFSGISVNVRNLFFEESVRLTRDADCKPDLSVMPSGVFAAPVSESSEGNRENRKVSVWKGTDIHSLREYCIGDDLRHVDWKVSAKYDKIFIRKYTGVISHPPLIIVDLPWSGAPWPEKEFNRMIAEVTGMVRHTIQTYQHASALLISGPNILHVIREEKSLSRGIAELREWMHPAERPVHFYRMPDRSDLKTRVRTLEHALPETTDARILASLELLRDRYVGILQYQRIPVFTGQVDRALAQLPVTEAYLFSLGCGDSSHIRHVVRQLQSQKVRVHVRIMEPVLSGTPEGTDTPADTREAGA
jgi:uncharacterized protein (DUF58 family)